MSHSPLLKSGLNAEHNLGVLLQVSDTLFTWADLQAKQNNELLKNLGNFVHRALSFLVKPAGEAFGVVDNLIFCSTSV